MKLQLPTPLKKNSTIGLICPGSGFDDYKPIKSVIKYLNNLGYKTRLGRSIYSNSRSNNVYKYLSASDQKRLSDLYDFWNDKNIDAIFCLKGGYGTLRLLDCIDFNLLKNKNKVLLGFSDITILLLTFYKMLNLLTFHGPLLGSNFLNKNSYPIEPNSANYIWELLQNKKFYFSYQCKCVVISKGKAEGPLIGGNLTSICSMLGSAFLPDFKDKILFLEDYNEEPYKIDRLLTQLNNAKLFTKINGLVVGKFFKSKFRNNNDVIKLLRDKISHYNIPIIYGFPIGHGKENYIVPIGLNVMLDANNCILRSC